MKRIILGFAMLIFVGITAQMGFAQSEKEKNRNIMVKLTKLLEEKPFDANAKDYRAGAFNYIAKTKDVSVVVCGGDFTKPLLNKKNKFGAELLSQYTMAMAAFKLSNPDKAENETAAQMAGIESVLRAYESMVTANSEAKFKGMDELLAKRGNGELKTMIENADCGGKTQKKDKK